jgi:4-hydroxy-2-oxoglutarate aldolase
MLTLKAADPKLRDNHDAARSYPDLRGLLLPCPTPFTSSGEPDLQALCMNIEKWSISGVSGFALLGSTGERVHLDEREYRQTIAVTREVVPREADGPAFIVGVGQQSTRGTINEATLAAAAGADAVLVLTPHFYRPAITQDALIAHYTAVADSSPAPVILYSMPALTGIKIEPETILRLSEHANIIGVKDSSADVEGLRRTVELVSESSSSRSNFKILTGNGTVFYEALSAGAAGAILAVGCVVPDLCLEIFQAVKNGDNQRGAAMQEKLTPLAQAVTTKFGIGGLKAALDMIGFAGGAVRAPLQSPDEAARAEIAHWLAEAQSISAVQAVAGIEA